MALAASAPSETPARSRTVRVLVVDSDATEAAYLHSLIEYAGLREFRVAHVCSDVDAAAKVLENEEVDFVLAEIRCVTGTNMEDFRKSLKISEYLPIVLLHEEADAARALEAMKGGAQDALLKNGLTPGLLRRVLRYSVERAAIEIRLARERDFFYALLSNVPDRIYFKDRKGRFFRVSASMARFLGLSEAEVIGYTDFDFYPEEYARVRFRDEQRVIETGEPLVGVIEKEAVGDGPSAWASTTRLPLRDRQNNVIGTFGISRDITQLKLLETALATERNLLRSVINNIPDPIFVKDVEGRYVLDNAAHRTSLKMESEEDVIGKTVFDFFSEKSAQHFQNIDRQVIETGEPILNHEEEAVGPDGSRRWLLTTKVPHRDGNRMLIVCVNRDITKQKEAEFKLIEANADLTAALADVKRMHTQMQGLQLQLIEAEKAKSIARLSAGVAHEVKNPLAIISMGVEFLSSQYPDDATTLDVLKELGEAVRRADTVIKGLLDFSAPKQMNLEESDMNEVIQRALVLVRGEMKSDIHKIELNLGEIPPVQVDRDKVIQVFVNILTNALHAMEEGGTLTVSTRSEQITGVGSNIGGARSEVFRAGDRVVVTEVCDTGHGFPPESLARIFDPFFTTKPTGKGTGLGMSVVKSIIDLHGGTISIQNRRSKGAMVTITWKA